MKIKGFVKDKAVLIVLLSAAVASALLFMLMYGVEIPLCIYLVSSVGVAAFAGLALEFFIKKRFYNKTLDTLEGLKEKYLISEMTQKADFEEAGILNYILSETEKSRLENVEELRRAQEEYKDFLELWIHEVKLPIATADLIIKNNPEPNMKKIGHELARIENYTMQALFYARSNTLEKDYMIVKCSLKSLVNDCIKKNKELLIGESVRVYSDISDEEIVYTDGKWVSFILDQIVDNAVKYMEGVSEKKLAFSVKRSRESVVLKIEDNGCGIAASDISRVFDKGYTGSNGRTKGRKATGIGLYLCKKLCTKMNVGISISSVAGEGTSVNVIFPAGSFTGIL